MTSPAKSQSHTRHRAAFAVLVIALIVAAVAFSSGRVSSQGGRPPVRDIDSVVREFDRLTLTPRDLLKGVRQNGRVTLATSRGKFDLDVEPFDILGANYRAVEVGADGISRDLPRAPARSFRGKVAGMSETYVRLVLDEGAFQGIIITPTETFFVEPRRNFNPAAANSEFVFYAKSSLIQQSVGECGTTLAEQVGQRSSGKSDSAFANAGTTPAPLFGPSAVAEIATEADFEFTSNFVSSAAANSDIQTIITMVDGIYDANLGIKISIVFQRTFVANNDPYTLTAPNAAIAQFRDEYDESFLPGAPPVRDLTHMFFGKEFDGTTIGIAAVSVICNFPELSYGISESLYDGPTTPQSLRAVLTAHEIGHNFGAGHPDEEIPPPAGCTSTIMHSQVTNSNQFCQFSRNQITNHALGTGGSCLSRSAPGCSYSLNGTSLIFPAIGGNGSVAVTAGGGCAWGVAKTSSWLAVSPDSGNGNGAVNFTAPTNTGGPRYSILDIGAQKFTVVQAKSPNCAVTPITPGPALSGSLASGDCLSGQAERENAFVDIYSFNGMAGQRIRLEMSDDPSASPTVDTYLYLLAPDGLFIAENDDIQLGVIINSRIPVAAGTFFTLPQTGTYTIVATSFSSGEAGGYTLTLTSPPLLLTAQVPDSVGSGAALNSVTFARSSNPPGNTAFRIFDPLNFSADQTTRLILFTSDLGLAQQQSPPANVVSVTAGGRALTVEHVGPFTFPGLSGSYLIVSLGQLNVPPAQQGNLSFQVIRAGTLTSNVTTLTIVP